MTERLMGEGDQHIDKCIGYKEIMRRILEHLECRTVVVVQLRTLFLLDQIVSSQRW